LKATEIIPGLVYQRGEFYNRDNSWKSKQLDCLDINLVVCLLSKKDEFLTVSKDGQILSLKAKYIREVGAKALAQRDDLSKLRALDLSQNDIGDEGVRAIAESPVFSNLRQLNLKSNQITDTGAGYLANSATLTSLRSLQMVVNDLTEEGEKLLRNSPHLISLTSLKFRV